MSNFQDPPPRVYLRPKFFTPLTLNIQFWTTLPHPLQQTTEQLHRACEWAKSKQNQNKVTSHLNWPRVLLFDLAHSQCNGIIKGWLHCVTTESKGRFHVNNILMFDTEWCLVMRQIPTSRTLAASFYVR